MKWPIGVFASIDAGLGVQLDVAHDLGIETIQLHAPAKATRTPAVAAAFLGRLGELDIQLTAVFGGFEGESYASIPITAQTVGLVPSATRAERTQEMIEIADFARLLQCDVVALHLGFVPAADSDDYPAVVEITRGLCDHCRTNGQRLHLETGQETADHLLQFMEDVQRDNLHVNFDPANMILYGTGEPIEALRKIGQYVKSVHCKDALWSDQPGQTWGEEVPLGAGAVGVENYLRTLAELGYEGPLTIEREIPREPKRQRDEIRHAAELLRGIKAKLKVS